MNNDDLFFVFCISQSVVALICAIGSWIGSIISDEQEIDPYDFNQKGEKK